MKIFLLILLVNPLMAQLRPPVSERMALMDQAMRKLNLTDVHFMNPGNIVNVDTIVNSHVIQDKEELIRRMKQKVNDTANEMVRNQPQQVPEWNRARVKLPRPVVRNQSRIHSG